LEKIFFMRISELIITTSQLLSIFMIIGLIVFGIYKSIKEKRKMKKNNMLNEKDKIKVELRIDYNSENKNKSIIISSHLGFSHFQAEATNENIDNLIEGLQCLKIDLTKPVI
jgi:predicted membrane protein